MTTFKNANDFYFINNTFILTFTQYIEFQIDERSCDIRSQVSGFASNICGIFPSR